MKIIVGTPRSGTTFYTRYKYNEDTSYKYLAEYFQPYYYPKERDPYDVTAERLRGLTDDVIFKVHTGTETDHRVIDFIKTKKVSIVKRNDIWGQILSFGIAYLNDNWVMYEGEQNYKVGVYEKEWFDDLTLRLDYLEDLIPQLQVSEILWYEDIPKYEINGRLPKRQNTISQREQLNLFQNSNQLVSWFDEWKDARNI